MVPGDACGESNERGRMIAGTDGTCSWICAEVAPVGGRYDPGAACGLACDAAGPGGIGRYAAAALAGNASESACELQCPSATHERTGQGAAARCRLKAGQECQAGTAGVKGRYLQTIGADGSERCLLTCDAVPATDKGTRNPANNCAVACLDNHVPDPRNAERCVPACLANQAMDGSGNCVWQNDGQGCGASEDGFAKRFDKGTCVKTDSCADPVNTVAVGGRCVPRCPPDPQHGTFARQGQGQGQDSRCVLSCSAGFSPDAGGRKCLERCQDGMSRVGGSEACTWTDGVACVPPGPAGFTGAYSGNVCVKTGCTDVNRALVGGTSCDPIPCPPNPANGSYDRDNGLCVLRCNPNPSTGSYDPQRNCELSCPAAPAGVAGAYSISGGKCVLLCRADVTNGARDPERGCAISCAADHELVGGTSCERVLRGACQTGDFTGVYQSRACVPTGCADSRKTLSGGACVWKNEGLACADRPNSFMDGISSETPQCRDRIPRLRSVVHPGDGYEPLKMIVRHYSDWKASAENQNASAMFYKKIRVAANSNDESYRVLVRLSDGTTKWLRHAAGNKLLYSDTETGSDLPVIRYHYEAGKLFEDVEYVRPQPMGPPDPNAFARIDAVMVENANGAPTYTTVQLNGDNSRTKANRIVFKYSGGKLFVAIQIKEGEQWFYMKSSGELTGSEVHGFDAQDRGGGHYSQADVKVWLMAEGSISRMIKEGGRYPLVINAVNMDGKFHLYMKKGVALVYGEQRGDKVYNEIVYWNGRRELYEFAVYRLGHEVFWRGVPMFGGFTRVCNEFRTVNEAGECRGGPPPPPADGVACSPGAEFTGAYKNNVCVKTGCAELGKTLTASGVCAFGNEGALCGTEEGFEKKFRSGECVRTVGCATGYREAAGGKCQQECLPGKEKWRDKCMDVCVPPMERYDMNGACMCPSGFFTINNKCVEPCPRGQVYSKTVSEQGQCVTEGTVCGSDSTTKRILTYRYDGWCGDPQPDCVKGYSLINNRCV